QPTPTPPKRGIERLASLRNEGSILLYVMVFGALAFSFVVTIAATYTTSEYKATVYRENREKAFQIAESGINYYVWHLAKNGLDFTDGTTTPQPYVHEFKNNNGDVIGYFSLIITAPSGTSTQAIVESTGWLSNQTQSRRTIRAKFTPHSLTDYAYVSNTSVWIGNDDVVHGKLHSNSGVRFDGTTDAPVTSAVLEYECTPIHGSGCQNETKPGIWGQGGPETFWSFPVPAEDFSGGTEALTLIKASAQAYGDGSYFSSSGKYGWLLHFTSDGNFTASKVNAVNSYKGDDPDGDNNVWFTVDVKTTDAGTTYPLPSNGLIYVDDTTWVDGVVNGNVTVGVANGKDIIFNNNFTYFKRDGSSNVGLVSGQDIIIPHDVPETLTLDGALFTGNGAAKRYYYSGDKRDQLNLYGSIASAGAWTWHYVSQGGSIVSGFESVSSTYDNHLTNNPPLGFPHSSIYAISSWEEVH
ncbi:MAG: hypothetical protein AAB467_04520, partial [Patescibacteria group bacterium]